MEVKHRINRYFFTFVAFLALIAFALFVFNAIGLYNKIEKRKASTLKVIKQYSYTLDHTVNKKLAAVERLATTLSNKLSSGKISYQNIRPYLLKKTKENPDIFGFGVAFAPYQYKSNLKLYAPYVFEKTPGEFIYKQVEKSYDYTNKKAADNSSNWFLNPMHQGAMWNKPAHGIISKTYLAEYAVPFYHVGKTAAASKPAGIVFTNYSVDDLRNILKNVPEYKTAYGMIVEKNGLIVAHPVFGSQGKTIASLSRMINKNQFTKLVNKLSTSPYVFYTSSNGLYYVFMKKLKHSPWYIMTVFAKEQILGYSVNRKIDAAIINTTVSFLVFLMLLIIFLLRKRYDNKGGLWFFSALFTLSCILIIFLKINFFQAPEKHHLVPIINPTELTSFLNSHLPGYTKSPQKYRLLKSGLFINDIEFTDIHHVKLAGWLWTKYPAGQFKENQKGFFFPQQAAVLRKNYNFNINNLTDGTEVSGWHFVASFRQDFGSDRYPFVRRSIVIEVWPKPEKNAPILIPDFSSYPLIKPYDLPGINKKTGLKRWEFIKSYFAFELSPVATSFGLDLSKTDYQRPVLAYVIELKRKLIGPIMRYFAPLLVILILIFIGLVTPHSNKKGAIFSRLTFYTSLLLILTLAHVSIRDRTTAGSISYVEYCYLIVESMILLVSLNSLLYLSKGKFPIIDYKNNLIPKLLFWPACSSALLVVTWLLF